MRSSSPSSRSIADAIEQIKSSLASERVDGPLDSISKLLKQLKGHPPLIQAAVGGCVAFSATWMVKKFAETVVMVFACGAIILFAWQQFTNQRNSRRISKKAKSLTSSLASKGEKLADRISVELDKVMNSKSKRESMIDQLFGFTTANRNFLGGAFGGAFVAILVS